MYVNAGGQHAELRLQVAGVSGKSAGMAVSPGQILSGRPGAG